MITSSSSSFLEKTKTQKKRTLDGVRINKACHNLFVSDPKNKGRGKTLSKPQRDFLILPVLGSMSQGFKR